VRSPHSICTPAVFTTVVHLSRSRARQAANSSGEVIVASGQSFTSVPATSGDLRLSLIAPLSLPTIAAGVLAGATTAVNETDVKSGTPASIIVGRSGVCAPRLSLVEARARTLPAWTSGKDEAGFSNENWGSPAPTALAERPPPLAGTRPTARPSRCLNISPIRCGGVPIPAEE